MLSGHCQLPCCSQVYKIAALLSCQRRGYLSSSFQEKHLTSPLIVLGPSPSAPQPHPAQPLPHKTLLVETAHCGGQGTLQATPSHLYLCVGHFSPTTHPSAFPPLVFLCQTSSILLPPFPILWFFTSGQWLPRGGICYRSF